MKLTKDDLGYLMITASVLMANYYHDWKLAIILILGIFGSRFMKSSDKILKL